MPCNTKAFLSKMGIEMTGVDYQEVAEVDSSFGGEKVDIYDPNLTFEEAIINFARRHGVPNKDFSSQNPDVIGNATHIDLVDYEPKNSMLDAGMEVATKIETAIQNTNHPSQENISYAKGVEENMIGFGGCVDGGMELTKQEIKALNEKGFNIGTAEDVVSKHKKRENKKFVGTLAKDAAKVGLVVQLFLNTGCTPRNITPSPAEITPTESPIVETTDLPTAIAIEIPTEVPVGSENQAPTETVTRLSVTAEDVKNVEPSLKLGVDINGDLTGLPENTTQEKVDAVKLFYDGVIDKFPGTTVFYDQDIYVTGKWALYAISPSGKLITQTYSYQGGAEQFADYPFWFDSSTGEVLGNYTEVDIPGGTIGVVWKNGYPQFLADKITLPNGDTVFSKFMEYKTYAGENPWDDISDLKQYLEQFIPAGPAGELVLNAPDTLYDASGLHITLSDSSRVIDIETADIENQVIFDEEFNLYKIFDAEGNITAEYDPGQGKEGDEYYVPPTGWVDIQKLATDLVCNKGDGTACINPNNRPQFVNSVWFEFMSTGIYKYKEVVDEKTGVNIGKVLLLQVASKDTDQDSVVVWMLVQAEKNSEPGINKYRAFAQNGFTDQGLGLDTDGRKIVEIEQWLEWNKKGSKKTYSLLRSGRSYLDFLIDSNKETYNVSASSFLNTGEVDKNLDAIILVSNGRSSG